MIHSVPYFQSLATNQRIACEFCIVQKLQSQRLLSPPPPASAGQRLFLLMTILFKVFLGTPLPSNLNVDIDQKIYFVFAFLLPIHRSQHHLKHMHIFSGGEN